MRTQLQRAIVAALIVTVCLGVMPPIALAENAATVPSAEASPVAGAAPSGPAETAVSATEATPSVLACRLEDDAASVSFAGTWTYCSSDSASGRGYRRSRTSGAAAAASFEGTSVAWVGPVGPDRGRARVYVDGIALATVDTYAPAWATQQTLFRVDGLSAARHNVRVVVLGSKSATSTAAYVGVDAFDFAGRAVSPTSLPGTQVQNGDVRMWRKGSWATSRRSVALKGSSARTTQADAAYTVRFKGTAVTWFGRKDAQGGKAEVYLDGRRVATVDQYSPVTRERRVVYAASGLANRVHSLRIRALRSPAVTGGGVTTDLDAFLVRGTVLTAPRPTPFKYPWKTYIVIDKSSYKLYWVKNKWLIKTYPVAHGKNDCTPERVWRIDAKYPHTSGVYGPRKMRLFKRVGTSGGYRYVYSAYGIHGTNQPWVIGTMASHGCIRMYNKDVTELYPQVPLGTMVVTRH